MKQTLRYFLFLIFFALTANTLMAQLANYKELYKVKRKETIFGIARANGLSVDELINANPEMKAPGYELKKGDYIRIPYPSSTQSASPSSASATQEITVPQKTKEEVDVRQREIRVGVMLPLHDENGDGKRMVEYYRGVLMACDSLRANGISTDIRAWNVAEDADINQTLKDVHAADRDIIIGPLYSKQVKALSDFATAHDIRILIPFSINTPELNTNNHIFQVYQSPTTQNEAFVTRFIQRFKDYHPILIDCNDSTSQKGAFTATLRRKLESAGIKYSLTNLKSSEDMFQKAFSTTKRNIVILNTGRSPELNVAFAKLNGLTMTNPNLQISMFGYTDWMMYTRNNLDNFYKYDVYIPAVFYTNPLSSKTERINLKYRWNFHQDMMNALPRFAITGFDQAYFFLKGLHMYGKQFTGAAGQVGYTPIQTPLHFERVGTAGGWQNRAMLFVHYMPTHRVETINF